MSSQTFTTERIVRFGECDPAGVVYYPVFFNWFHELMEEWFERALDISYAACIQKQGFPAKETKAEFFRPCAVGELLELKMSLAYLSSRSFRMDIEVWGKGKKKAAGYVVCVCIGVLEDGFRFAPTEIPLPLREKMEKFVSNG